MKDVEAGVNTKRAALFVSETNPFIPGVDTDRWYSHGFGELPPVEDVLQSFIENRLITLETLKGIARDAWHMPARHSIFGPTDLYEIAGIMAAHDRNHIRQIKTNLHVDANCR